MQGYNVDEYDGFSVNEVNTMTLRPISIAFSTISIVSGIATACGCGTVFTAMDENENQIQISVGTTYYYEQAKAHRINAENTSYSGFDPFEYEFLIFDHLLRQYF